MLFKPTPIEVRVQVPPGDPGFGYHQAPVTMSGSASALRSWPSINIAFQGREVSSTFFCQYIRGRYGKEAVPLLSQMSSRGVSQLKGLSRISRSPSPSKSPTFDSWFPIPVSTSVRVKLPAPSPKRIHIPESGFASYKRISAAKTSR